MKQQRRIRRVGESGTPQRPMEQKTVSPQTLLQHHSLPLTNLAEAGPQKTQRQRLIKTKRSRLHLGVEVGGAERGQHPPRIPPQQPRLNQSVARYQNRKKRIPSEQDNRGRLTCRGKNVRYIAIRTIFLVQFHVDLLIRFRVYGSLEYIFNTVAAGTFFQKQQG